jgi:hypothetical protein
VVRATLARSEAKSGGRRWRSQGGEEFAYHALVRLAQIRTSGENLLNFGCVARLSSVRQDPGGRRGVQFGIGMTAPIRFHERFPDPLTLRPAEG